MVYVKEYFYYKTSYLPIFLPTFQPKGCLKNVHFTFLPYKPENPPNDNCEHIILAPNIKMDSDLR